MERINGEWRMESGECYALSPTDLFAQRSFFNLFFVVLTILTKSLFNSSAFGKSKSNSSDIIYSLSFNNWSQYNVSLASFKDIFILWRKSAKLCACSASRIKAPIEVALLKSCLDRINSFRSETISLNNLIIERAKSYDLSATTFFDIIFGFKGMIDISKYRKSPSFHNPAFFILHFQFSIQK